MNIPTIETSRLSLRPFTPADAPRLSAILHEEGILDYFPDPTPPPLEVTERSIARRLEHWAQYGYGRWAVMPRDTGVLAGWCGMDYATELGCAELTYLLSASVWGRGYATEAARATVRFGFEAAGLERIMSMAHPDNIASNKVIQRCGLRVSGSIVIEETTMLLYSMDRPGSPSAAAEAAAA